MLYYFPMVIGCCFAYKFSPSKAGCYKRVVTPGRLLRVMGYRGRGVTLRDIPSRILEAADRPALLPELLRTLLWLWKILSLWMSESRGCNALWLVSRAGATPVGSPGTWLKHILNFQNCSELPYHFEKSCPFEWRAHFRVDAAAVST